jgi:hypothetical protein
MRVLPANALNRQSRALPLTLSVWVVRLTVIFLVMSCCTSQAWMMMPLQPPTLEDGGGSGSPPLWALRVTSALASYIGLVAYLDRPRGTLYLQPHQYEIRPSSVQGAGLGMYITQDLEKNTILGSYPGVVLPLSQNSAKLAHYPHCEAYVWRFSDSQQIIDPTDQWGNLPDYCWGGNPNVPCSTLICRHLLVLFLTKVPVPTTLCRINEPPKGNDVNVITNENLKERTVTFVLERNVYAGEELFMDYGLCYDRSGYGQPSSDTTKSQES